MNNTDLTEKIKKRTLDEFKSILNGSINYREEYKNLIMFEGKPLLITGNLNTVTEDGFCMAIYNPDNSVIDRIDGNTAYNKKHLRRIISKKCDLMLRTWIALGDTDDVCVFDKYEPKQNTP